MTATPGTTLDINDPGDDVQRRFRYQHAFTAIHCARLLQPECEYDTIYCENLEDALLRKKNGRFVGIQVKTRAFHLEPFKAGDAAVKKSIGRFADLEGRFPGQFEGYRFVTNHGFWAEKDNQHCLNFLIRTLKERGGVKGLRSTHELRAWIAQQQIDWIHEQKKFTWRDKFPISLLIAFVLVLVAAVWVALVMFATRFPG